MAKDGNKIDASAWMVTFSDLLTLMLTFFVLLLSMSSMNAMKLKVMFGPLRGAVGPLKKGQRSELGSPLIMHFKRIQGESENEMLILYLELKRAIQDEVPENQSKTIKLADTEIQIRSDERGAVMSLPQAILFPPGGVELHEQGRRILDRIGMVLRWFNNFIALEGHTDNQRPTSARYTTNWELSMGRALSVLDYMVDEVGMLPQRISAAGYASYRPIGANDTPEGRSRNRRVEVVVLKSRTVWR